MLFFKDISHLRIFLAKFLIIVTTQSIPIQKSTTTINTLNLNDLYDKEAYRSNNFNTLSKSADGNPSFLNVAKSVFIF